MTALNVDIMLFFNDRSMKVRLSFSTKSVSVTDSHAEVELWIRRLSPDQSDFCFDLKSSCSSSTVTAKRCALYQIISVAIPVILSYYSLHHSWTHVDIFIICTSFSLDLFVSGRGEQTTPLYLLQCRKRILFVLIRMSRSCRQGVCTFSN
jgi:hypothetical protein